MQAPEIFRHQVAVDIILQVNNAGYQFETAADVLPEELGSDFLLAYLCHAARISVALPKETDAIEAAHLFFAHHYLTRDPDDDLELPAWMTAAKDILDDQETKKELFLWVTSTFCILNSLRLAREDRFDRQLVASYSTVGAGTHVSDAFRCLHRVPTRLPLSEVAIQWCKHMYLNDRRGSWV